MKKNILYLLTFLAAQVCSLAYANEPDSAYVFAYATDKNGNHNGLHFAWSTDISEDDWHPIGPEHSFLKSDYGAWGRDKRMISPVLFRGNDQLWHCVWTLNEQDGVIAYATSTDLVNWSRQSYPELMPDNNCMAIEVSNFPNKYRASNEYLLSWISNKSGKDEIYCATTTDFKTFSSPQKGNELSRWNQRIGGTVFDRFYTGTIHKVSWKVIDNLIKAQQLAAYKSKLYAETTKEDPIRFASLKPVDASITMDAANKKKISDLLIGIFFEDINYAADGGLYAELIQNRGFEYDLSDKQGRDNTWDHSKSWALKGDKTLFTIDTVAPLHPNNKHYAKLEITQVGAALTNEGFNGIPLKTGDKYYFSLFSRVLNGKGGKFIIRLVDGEGNICAQSSVNTSSVNWKKQEITLTSKTTVTNAHLEILPQFAGTVALDMISLFPQKTFKGRRNGLREDLAQVLADMKPRFVRFPGGCVAHGNGLENMYRWKNTVGPLEARKSQRNIWNYHQTAGLGYFEYFQFCEDIGAEPVPVVAAGVPCQNSSIGGNGQQGGIPMCEMDDYVQEVLDLIEWANGDVKTKWGKLRAEAGHPKPFNLKYVGVGNEDLITDIFEERFTMIYNAVKEKYPEIVVIGTVGPFSEGTDYVEGWDIATKLGVPMVDEHYYQPPGWFIHNQDYYDRYDRNKSKVYLGEYAAHLPGRPVNIETALTEALYLTTLERNGDVVSMTSYAPLLAKEGYTQWNPDLIYFNNTEVKPTVGYYVQKLYGQHSGDSYIPCKVELSNQNEAVRKRVAISAVHDSKTGDVIIKMVNLLPVAVKPTLSLPEVTSNATIMKYVLQGEPSDRRAKPIESTCTMDDLCKGELPAYSFIIYRIKNNNTKK
ncbi:alpha-L-arabinofuranosidase C-terminal domain-containing protein [Bacteroides sp. 224]|uniref:alpha-L-arabinofuranosidase C-terminal domain-containing protein n=1 Tax=Bacteroides sp. 224 TaxID=2302936 RepID=UPI0013D3CF1D|nr:alpha-L-arabinofuranosidase C-terminal domain-containing protein [Bacteroides sp. 224]NDV66974.1 alpha-L-arabinofuranosidase [Bacteroides sp. 224]